MLKIVLKVLAISEPILALTAVVQVHLQNMYSFWDELNNILYLGTIIHPPGLTAMVHPFLDEDFLRITYKLRERVGFLYNKRKKILFREMVGKYHFDILGSG